MSRLYVAAVLWLCCATLHAGPPVSLWMTCDWVEGKGGDCTAGEPPHAFEYYLHPENWDKHHFDLGPGVYANLKPQTRDIGKLGTYVIRAVRYFHGDVPSGDVLLAERSPGLFAPLMWWAAAIEPPVLHRGNGVQVLAMSKDFGNDIPTVETWAWAWGPDGIVRLNVRGAKDEAVRQVAPDYTAYDTAVDWEKLHLTTWAWKGEWPGKSAVGAKVEVWFEIRGVTLAPKRVQFTENGQSRTWPE